MFKVDIKCVSAYSCAVKQAARSVFFCVTELAYYNEKVRTEAVHRKSVKNNNGVHGKKYWICPFVLSNLDIFVMFKR